MVEQKFLEGKKVLVTGATGHIGRGLAYILSKNNEVHAAARFSKPEIKEELASFCDALHQIDFGSKDGVEKLPKDFDVVFNQAVLWDPWDKPFKEWDDFRRVMEVNSFLPGRLMMYYGETGTKLVFGSTGGLYIPSKDRNDLNVEGKTCWEGGECIYEDTKMGNDIIVSWLSKDCGIQR